MNNENGYPLPSTQCPAKSRLILARLGEIALKGLNRCNYEHCLFMNLRRRLDNLGKFNVTQKESRIWIKPMNKEASAHLDEALLVACKVFGLVSASLVTRYEALDSLADILAACIDYSETVLSDGDSKTFKVEAKRGDKRLPYPSNELVKDVGACLLDHFPQLQVDIKHPQFTLELELRDALYIYHEKTPGLKGLPVGTSGKSMLLLSGGIDSPVAGYMMASRGVVLEAIYFHTYPYTSDRAKEKVLDLGRILCGYIGRLYVNVVDFTSIQMQLNEACRPEMMTIVMRRMMMRIADELASRRGCISLITGESLGQVASQTNEALATTDAVVEKPVYRPLIGLDKDSSIMLARKIGTFETSILPYEDCCTVFVAKHPRTRPSLHQAIEAEANLDIPALLAEGLGKIERILLP